MGCLPWFKFFPADWKHDTRCLSPATRGLWIDLLCALWPEGKKTLNRQTWLRELSVTEAEFTGSLDELHTFKIANVICCNSDVTVTSRRMIRELTKREQTRKRVEEHRRNANVTKKKRVEAKKLEAKRLEKGKIKSAKHAMPEGWTLSDAMIEYAKSKGMTPLTVQHQFEHCKTHHAENVWTEKGWASQVWQKWVLNWISYGSKQVIPQSAPPPQAKCAYVNVMCEEDAVPGSKYCRAHKELIQSRQQQHHGVVN